MTNNPFLGVPLRFVVAAGAVLAAAVVPALQAGRDAIASPAAQGEETPFAFARIYWEYNSSGNDLGVHVTLDGEDWKRLRIEKPNGQSLFEVKGRGPYQTLGMTELFFEGAEPSLNEVPLQSLLNRFPEGEYTFEGKTVDGEDLESTYEFSHAIPAAPSVSATLSGGTNLVITWTQVTSTPAGFPNRPIDIVGYQVIVGSYQVTLPATALSVTVSPEFVSSLGSGQHAFEVLAIDRSANQTITEGTFVK